MKKMTYEPGAVRVHVKAALGENLGKYGKLSAGPGDFGMTPHLGGKAFIKNPDCHRKFLPMSDGSRACPPPKGNCK